MSIPLRFCSDEAMDSITLPHRKWCYHVGMNPTGITFRPADGRVHGRLEALAERNERKLSVEMRAAVDVYLGLQDLVRVRELAETGELSREAAKDLEERVKDELGRVLLAAIPNDAESIFENAAGVEYPRDRIGTIVMPFEKLIDWIVTGRA